MDWDEDGCWLRFCWIAIFLGCYGYCIAAYGFLFGLGLGWLPAGIVATVAVALWPLVWRLFGLLLWLSVLGGILYAVGSYTIAVCLLVASLWHRYRRGAWPIAIGEEPPLPRRYPYRAKSPFRRAKESNGDSRGLRYRLSQSWQGWLRRFSSHV